MWVRYGRDQQGAPAKVRHRQDPGPREGPRDRRPKRGQVDDALELLRASPGFAGGETGAHHLLARFDLAAALRRKPLRGLSGGEKARVLCALIACQDAHLLLLDEPTNHLDLHTTAAVRSFPMGALVITHSRTFADMLGDGFSTVRV